MTLTERRKFAAALKIVTAAEHPGRGDLVEDLQVVADAHRVVVDVLDAGVVEALPVLRPRRDAWARERDKLDALLAAMAQEGAP